MENKAKSDNKYFLFEFPSDFDTSQLKELKHKDFKLSEKQLKDYSLALLDVDIMNKNKVLVFENNKKLKFKDIGNFIKFYKSIENEKPSFKNVINKKRKSAK